MSSSSGSYTYKWPRPSVTVDTLIFTMESKSVWLLLIKRKNDPFKGSWALPGGFVDENEGLDIAAARELQEETGLCGTTMAQVGSYGDPGRDPRGHTITVAYAAFVPSKDCGVKAGDDAAEAEWFALGQLPPLAFDHAKIIDDTWKRMMILPDPEPGSASDGYVIMEKGTGKILQKLNGEAAEVVSTAKP